MRLDFIDVSAVWLTALAAVPIAIGVSLVCRILPLRPATRHSLWLATLLTLFLPLLLPAAPVDVVAMQLESARATIGSLVGTAKTDAVREPTPQFETKPMPANRAAPAQPYERLTAIVQLPWNTGTVESAGPLAPLHGTAADASTGVLSPPILDSAPAAPPRDRAIADAAERAWHRSVTAHRPVDPAPRAAVRPSDARVSQPAFRPEIKNPSQPSASESIDLRSRAIAWLVAVQGALANALSAMLSLPMIPPVLWLTGIALIAALYFARIGAFRRQLRHSVAAPAHIRALVESAARTIGLRAIPTTVMVDACVSPMIWAGRRPVLVIPTGLWTQLDRTGRRAILFHELAHLKRRDHWVAWLEVFASLLYWWHPLVWWVRRRIHEEADLSCDAWVTWTLPQGRRAYAEALLRARQYISDGRAATPVGGMAAAGPRARTFARRLTMVMTRSVRPRTSMMGFLLAAAVAGIGWFAAPAIAQALGGGASAGPVRSANTSDEKVRVKFHATKNVDAEADGDDDGGGDDDESVVVFRSGQAVGGRSTGRQGDGIDRRLERLEAQIRMLSEQLAQLRAGAPQPPGHNPGADGQGSPPVPPHRTGGGLGIAAPSGGPQPPAAPSAPGLGAGRRGGTIILSPRGGSGGGGGAASGGMSGGPVIAELFTDNTDGPQVAREYALPAGKLEAFYELMVRDDVPIPVAKNDASITVHATEAQHRIIKAFLDMINKPAQGAAAESNPLAARELAVAAQQRVAETARTLAALERSVAQGRYYDAIKDNAAALRGAVTEANRARVQSLLESARQRAAEKRNEADVMEHQAEEMSAQAEQLAEQAERLSESAAEMMQNSDAGHGNEMKQRSEELRRQSREIQKQIRELEKRARELEQRRGKIETTSDAAEALADQIEEALTEESDVTDCTTTSTESLMSALRSVSAEPAATIAPEAPAAPGDAAAPTTPAAPPIADAPPKAATPAPAADPVAPEPTPAPR